MKQAPVEFERVRRHTAPRVNEKIDETIRECVRTYALASHDELTHRLADLEHEWDIERMLQANAATAALTGLALSFRDRRWLALPTAVLGFLLLHAVDGWCPPVPVLR